MKLWDLKEEKGFFARGTCYRIRIGSISNYPILYKEVLIPALRSLSSSSKLVDDKAPSIVPSHV